MNLEEFAKKLDEQGKLKKVSGETSKMFEISGVMHAIDGSAVLFENVKESKYRVIGNPFSSKELIAEYLDFPPAELVPRMIKALENPTLLLA